MMNINKYMNINNELFMYKRMYCSCIKENHQHIWKSSRSIKNLMLSWKKIKIKKKIKTNIKKLIKAANNLSSCLLLVGINKIEWLW